MWTDTDFGPRSDTDFGPYTDFGLAYVGALLIGVSDDARKR